MLHTLRLPSLPEPPTPIAPPQLLRAGSTYLIIQLNTNSIIGDGPIVRKEIEYRMTSGPWSEVHAVNMQTYKLWHLDPDTEYEISVLLTRPGEGGTGKPGPPLISRTKCAVPGGIASESLTFTPLEDMIFLKWEEPVEPNGLITQYEDMIFLKWEEPVEPNGLITQYERAEHGALVLRPPLSPALASPGDEHPVPVRHRGGGWWPALISGALRRDLLCVSPQSAGPGRAVPGGIASESLTFTPLEDMIFLKWEEPVEPNGLITQYEISYQSIESSDPAVNVPGPRRTVSKLRNETYHVFSNLHPGTTYLFSVRARTGKGFGQTALTEITTNISAPTFDYGDMPSPLSESESTITVLLRPAQGRGAPISTYQVIVEEDRPKKIKRELGGQECFPVPLTFDDAVSRGSVHYFGAELPASSLTEAKPFTVGDNQTYSGYWNPPLEPKKAYLIYFQAMSNLKGETRLNCIRIARKVLRSRSLAENWQTRSVRGRRTAGPGKSRCPTGQPSCRTPLRSLREGRWSSLEGGDLAVSVSPTGLPSRTRAAALAGASPCTEREGFRRFDFAAGGECAPVLGGGSLARGGGVAGASGWLLFLAR
nr:PREDICTED: receptor-type tyrosine-protein phosphatase U-like [Apteryx mantelli mantelli]